ncbi:MAG: 1-deoxy-D-xylulose-5-phosphate reductoisomerase [Chloroflexi bacterium RBG_19FT_COMBO_48_23]|nr:MAG: 1-deoxy-D-xylulose-5-phosphate reductoisomerase [Chloroflexi bacterium RBG_19FT_COMBO_48_23]
MSKNIKKLAVLGSTGSIGQQALDIIKDFPGKFRIVGLAGGNNTSLLAKQISQFQPKLVYSPLKFNLPDTTKFSSMEEIVTHPDVDIAIIATSSKIGLAPTLAAIRSGKKIALANKEVLVMAGEIIMAEAKKYQAKILPVDSEHSAIWQCLHGEKAEVARLILTASGGPFYHLSPTQLAKVTAEEALQHPTWKMGRKVTIDSATLMNKGLETIEAHWLFSIPFNKIEIVIHPQSIIHSLVEFADGSLKAQLSVPDMRFPIQYALSYPKRLVNPRLPRIDLPRLSPLTFEKINYAMFPCLQLALDAGKRGGTYPAVLCAADEIAVELFLEHSISFSDISEIIASTISLHQGIANPTIDEILAADDWARDTALKLTRKANLCLKQ